MINYFILPGYGNSNEGHWQTYFENQLPNCKRIMQVSWDAPQCKDWVDTIEKTLSAYDLSTVVLITHSLGGIALAHWSNEFKRKIKGALIVAPPDIENPYLDLSLESFTPIPSTTLPFPSIVIASDNDNWATVDRSIHFASHWGSELVLIEKAGHINTSAGYGKWEAGLEILKRLIP